MTRAEMQAVSSELKTIPDVVLRMFINHPNQVSELAANEMQLREKTQTYITLSGTKMAGRHRPLHPGWSVKV